jgi:hypothetical protein
VLFAKSVQEPDEKIMVQTWGRFFFRFWLPTSLSEFFPALRVGFFDNDNVLLFLLFFPRGEDARISEGFGTVWCIFGAVLAPVWHRLGTSLSRPSRLRSLECPGAFRSFRKPRFQAEPFGVQLS